MATLVISVVSRLSGLWSLSFRRAHNRLKREEGACLPPLGFVGPYLQVAKQLPKQARINPSTPSDYAEATQTRDLWLLGPYITTQDAAVMHHPCSPSLSPSQPSPPPNRYKRACVSCSTLTDTTLSASAPKRRPCEDPEGSCNQRRYESDDHSTPNSSNVHRRKSGWRNHPTPSTSAR